MRLVITEVRNKCFRLVTQCHHYNDCHKGPACDITEGNCDDHRVWYRTLFLC